MDAMREALLQAAERVPDLSLLVLFGSRSRQDPRPDSDLDVAVLSKRTDARARRMLQARVAAALAHLSPAGRVDVVLLDEAPVLLRQRIMETGRVILLHDPAAWHEWRVRTMREYGDSEWARRLYRRYQRRRLAEEEPDARSGRALRSLERALGLPR